MKAREWNKSILGLAGWAVASVAAIALVRWNGPAGLAAAVLLGVILGIYLMRAEKR